MANQGKIQLLYVIVCPPEHADEGKRLFESHGPWIESTHHREGSRALLSYNVSMAPNSQTPWTRTQSRPAAPSSFSVRSTNQRMGSGTTLSRPRPTGPTSQRSASGSKSAIFLGSPQRRSSIPSGRWWNTGSSTTARHLGTGSRRWRSRPLTPFFRLLLALFPALFGFQCRKIRKSDIRK